MSERFSVATAQMNHSKSSRFERKPNAQTLNQHRIVCVKMWRVKKLCTVLKSPKLVCIMSCRYFLL